MRALVRIVHVIVGIIVLIIVAGIVLVLLKANPTNTIVSDVHDAARWLAGPFDGIFSFHSARRRAGGQLGPRRGRLPARRRTDRATARLAPLDANRPPHLPPDQGGP